MALSNVTGPALANTPPPCPDAMLLVTVEFCRLIDAADSAPATPPPLPVALFPDRVLSRNVSVPDAMRMPPPSDEVELLITLLLNRVTTSFAPHSMPPPPLVA